MIDWRNDQQMMDLAKKLSRHSTHHQHKLGAVIARGRRVIGVGFNMTKTHPRSNARYHTIHAELKALLNAREDVSGASIYLYRARRDGTNAMAKPCAACQVLLRDAGVIEAIYTTYAGLEAMRL